MIIINHIDEYVYQPIINMKNLLYFSFFLEDTFNNKFWGYFRKKCKFKPRNILNTYYVKWIYEILDCYYLIQKIDIFNFIQYFYV